MAVFQHIFSVGRVADIHLRFNRAIKEAEAVELLYRRGRTTTARAALGRAQATQRELLRAYALFNRELDELAVLTAVDATERIRRQLKLTQKRPDTGHKPGLADLIRCRPVRRVRGVATGEVGIADEAWLDRAVNPLGPQYGPYWRAQEEGSTAHVGRVIRGYFADVGGGNAEVPRSVYAGGGGPHPIFLPASLKAGTRGGAGGYGTIRTPLRARHFIRDGSARAFIDYVAGVRAIEAQVLSRLSAI